MSISKKFYSIVLSIVAVFALVGCTLPTAFSRTISEAQADLQAVADRVVFDNLDEVTSDLVFPKETQWADKVTYEWHSSNEAVISTSGKVTRPETGAGNAEVVVKVVITAEYTKLDDGTFKLGTVSTEKEWKFTVLEMPEKLTIQKTLDKIVAGEIQKGDEVSFTGIVVAYNQKIYANEDGTSDLVLRPYVYDGTGGFFIYAQFNDLVVGDEVAVTGTLDAYNGYYQIKSSGISVEVLSKGNAIPEPVKASVGEVIEMNTVDGSLNGANGTIGGRLYNVNAKVVNNGTAEKPEYFLEDPFGNGKFEVYYETAYTHVPGHENAKSYAEVLAPYEGKYVNITVCPYNVYDGYISVVYTSLPITEIEKPELSDEQQASVILNQVGLDEEYREDFELPVVEGIKWEIVSGTGIELVDGVAKVTRTTEDQEVVLKATATYGEASVSKEFTVVIPGKPADPVVPDTVDEINLTVESLDLPSQAYSAGTVSVSGVAFEFVQLGNYGDGIQMRDKNGNTSLLWNTSAFGRAIAYIELTYSSTKDTYDNPDAVIYSFGNSVGEYTYTTKLSTTAGVKTYVITPDAETYTYFKLEHDYGYSMYWESINIVYVEQKQEAVETELDLTVETLDLPSQAYSAGTVTYAGVDFEFVQLGNYGDGIQMRDKNGNTSLLWNTSAFGSGIIRIELTYSSTKDTYDNPDAVIYSFGNSVGEYTYTTKLSTTVGVKTYTITPDAGTYTYFKLEHDYGYSMYWESIKVVYMTGGNLPEPPVHEHVFVEGKCECGEIDPNYVPAHVHEECPECKKCLDKECPDGDVCQGHTPVVGDEKYYLYVYQKNNSKHLYFNGETANSYYLGTTSSIESAVEIIVEKVENGYVLSFESNGVKKYLAFSVGQKVNASISNSEYVFTWNETYKTFTQVVNGTEYYMGTYNTFNTISASNISYASTSFVSNLVKADGTVYEPTVTPVVCEHEGGKATCKELATCTKCGETYGEFGDHEFSEGSCTVCGKEDPNYIPPHVHEECPECKKCLDKECPDGDICQGHEVAVEGGSADFNTIVPKTANGDSSYTNTYTTTAGWVTKNSAIQCGGSKDVNPQFTVVGPDNTYKAVCMNGKTSAPGSITSPTLNGGISVLKINWTKMFTDTAIKATVTVTEVATGSKQTYVIEVSLPKDEKYQIYNVEWTLETPVNGDFTIEIVNSCPSNSTSNKDRMTILSIEWIGHKEDVHEHDFSIVKGDHKTEGHWTECECGEKTEVLPHVDINLDITCDYEGCTKRIIPDAETKISLFTAQHMIVVTLSGNYYMEGVITEVVDAKNGTFIITDEAGDTIRVHMPKNASDQSYAQWENLKVVLGDTIQLYGKPTRNTSSQEPEVKSALLTVLKHEHSFGEPSCLLPATCACLATTGEPLGHTDTDANDFCDVCNWDLNTDFENILTRYNDVKDTDKVDTTNGTVLFEGKEFNVLLEKGTGTINTSGTDHFRVAKNNVLTISAVNGKKIVAITFVVTSNSYDDEMQAFLDAAGYEHTTSEDELEVTIKVDSLESVVLNNTSTKTARIKSIKVVYAVEKAPQEIEVTLYYKNADKWATVSTWIWNDFENFTGGKWPGAQMTLVEGTTDWYSYTFKVLSTEGIKVIFNDNGKGSQSKDLSYTGLNYWYGGNAYATIEEAEAAYAADQTISWSKWYLRGGMNSWGTADRLQMDAEGNSWIVVDLAKNVEFKVATSDWSKEFNFNSVTDKVNFVSAGGNIKVVTAGTYKIVVTAAGKLEITPVK